MDKVIEWLFQRTPDGSTYLQIIIIGLLFIGLIDVIFKTLEEVRKSVEEDNE